MNEGARIAVGFERHYSLGSVLSRDWISAVESRLQDRVNPARPRSRLSSQFGDDRLDWLAGSAKEAYAVTTVEPS